MTLFQFVCLFELYGAFPRCGHIAMGPACTRGPNVFFLSAATLEYHAVGTRQSWLGFTSHQQRCHLETAPPFTVPCKGREVRFLHVPTGNRTPGRRMVVHYSTAAPRQLHTLDLTCHIIQTQDRPVVVLSVNAERQTRCLTTTSF